MSAGRIFKSLLFIVFFVPACIWAGSLFQQKWVDYFSLASTFAFPLFGIICLAYNSYLGISLHKWHAGTNFFALALISYSIGEILFYSSVNFLHIELPYPTISDLWYSLFYPLLVAGIIVIILKVQGKYRKSDKWLAAAGIFVAFVFYFFMVNYGTQLYSQNPDGLKTFFDISYIVWDALLLVSIIALAGNIISFAKSSRYPLQAVFSTAISSIVMLLADTLFSYSTDLGTYLPGNNIDFIYFVSIYLLGYSILRFHDTTN